MKHFFKTVSSIILTATMFIATGCYRDIDERVDTVDKQIEQLDAKLNAMTEAISTISEVYATANGLDALKIYTQALWGDLELLKTAFNEYKDSASEAFASASQLSKLWTLVFSLNDSLVELSIEIDNVNSRITANKEEIESIKAALEEIKGQTTNPEAITELKAKIEEILARMDQNNETVTTLDLKVLGLEDAIKRAQESIANFSRLIYFITMELVPETLVEGAPAVLFHSDANSATMSVTLEVAPAARAAELEGHIAFSIVPVSTFTRASEATIINGETYSVSDNGFITVTASLPKEAPFIEPDYNLWNVEQAFAISAKYIDDEGLVQLSTPYVSAYLTSAGGAIPKSVALILGEKNTFWEAVAAGAADAATLEDGMTVEVSYCSTPDEQLEALEKLQVARKKNKGIMIYPIDADVEKAAAAAGTELSIPVTVVGKELSEASPLASIARTQVIMQDTTAIKKLDLYVANDGHTGIIIMGLEGSKTSQARVEAAQKFIPDNITPTVFMTTAEKAADQLSFTIGLIKSTAVMLLDDELIVPGVLTAANGISTYAFGTTPAIKAGVAGGSIRTGVFKNGYPFGTKGFEALFNDTPSPCLIDPETVLSEQQGN